MKSDTVAALSTAQGIGGIGVIRVSGEEALTIADRVVVNAAKEHDLTKRAANTIRFSYLVDDDGTVLDELLVSVFRAPVSYTGEDVVELNTHGGPFVTARALKLLLMHGARLAEPGEFTKRAFLNGRIDLSRAEAVMDVISADNERALKNAAAQLSGVLTSLVEPLRHEILHETARIEAALDDPEHFSLDGYDETLLPLTDTWLSELEALAGTFENGRRMKQGIPAVIAGAPNAGKSSLLNLLLMEDRAIVTEIPGTTRDTIRESFTIGGIPLTIADTAGIGESKDKVEQIGMERALLAVEEASLVLYVIDASAKETLLPKELTKKLSGKKVIVLFNKSDLPLALDEEAKTKLLSYFPEGTRSLSISALTGEGVAALRDHIRELYSFPEEVEDNAFQLTNERHKEKLTEATEALRTLQETIRQGMGEDLYTTDLTAAYRALSAILGETVTEDLYDEIFSAFCMGK